MPLDPVRLLVVNDARDRSGIVAQFISLTDDWADAAVVVADSYDGALAAIDREPFDLAFVDYWLDTHNGVSLLREIRRRGVETPVVILTSRGAEEVAVEAMKAGAADYLVKSQLSAEALGRSIRHALALSGEERQRRYAQAAVRVSEERFRALVENSSDVLLLIDADGRLVYLTPSARRHLGWLSSDMLGKSVFDFLHPDDRGPAGERIAEMLRRPGEMLTHEMRFQHADGVWRDMEGIAVNRLSEPSVGAIVINARDVTDRKRLEEQLRHSQKMDAVGQLAGGVAHDFNNLLTAILGYCNLMLDEVPPEDPLRLDLEEIRQAGERAAVLTQQLLAFSRRQMLQPQIVDINTLVFQMEKMLRRLIGNEIELVTALAPDLKPVKVDPASIEQVLVNLAMNARDAMPAGGRLTIETTMIDLDSAYADMHATVVPGPYVMLAVSDTGQGMDAATRARVFEPFFTTKEQGKGVGLGLATVYGIVKQSGGYIWVYSEPEHGTVFKVYFPQSVLPVRTMPAAQTASDADQPRGWETVLLVEDEGAVRTLAREVLRRHGYVVLEAQHGLDALRVAERHQDPIHLMVTDVVMPHMSGRDLSRRFAETRPGMKVLFVSGYTDHVVMHRELTPGSAFLQKPFTPDNLARAVRQVLDENGALAPPA